MTLDRTRLVQEAAMGSRKAMAELKALHPRRDLKRRWHEFQGWQVVSRGKGSKARWTVMS